VLGDYAKIDIVGHSMGGLVAAFWVATHQDDPKLKSIHSVITFDSPLQGIEEWKVGVARTAINKNLLGCNGDVTAIEDMNESSSVINAIFERQPQTLVPFVTIRAIGGGCVPVLPDDCITDAKATLPGVWKDLYAEMGNHFDLWESPRLGAKNLVISAVSTDPPR